jgi:hypothetical protein
MKRTRQRSAEPAPPTPPPSAEIISLDEYRRQRGKPAPKPTAPRFDTFLDDEAS